MGYSGFQFEFRQFFCRVETLDAYAVFKVHMDSTFSSVLSHLKLFHIEPLNNC